MSWSVAAPNVGCLLRLSRRYASAAPAGRAGWGERQLRRRRERRGPDDVQPESARARQDDAGARRGGGRGGGGGDGGRRRRAGIGREVRSGHSWGDAEKVRKRAERRSQGGGRGTEADRSKDQVAAQRRAGGSAVRENEVGAGQLWRRTGDPNLLRLGSTTLADRDAHRNAYEVGACSHAVMHHREGREGNKRRGEAEAEAQTQRQRLSLSVRWHFTPYGLNFCPGWGFSLPLPFLAMYSS